jgi:hypothetical protein
MLGFFARTGLNLSILLTVSGIVTRKERVERADRVPLWRAHKSLSRNAKPARRGRRGRYGLNVLVMTFVRLAC